MKQMRQFSLIALAVMLCLLTAGCMSVQTSQPLGTPIYKATDPSSISILRTPPERQNTRLGRITIEPTSSSTTRQIEEKFQQEAAKWGANAVVIVADQTELMGVVVSGPWWGEDVSPDLDRVIVGVAIRYNP